jgi:hypothetical protein
VPLIDRARGVICFYSLTSADAKGPRIKRRERHQQGGYDAHHRLAWNLLQVSVQRFRAHELLFPIAGLTLEFLEDGQPFPSLFGLTLVAVVGAEQVVSIL